MPRKPGKLKLGQYRHSPGGMLQPGPDGRLRPAQVRRRFPFRGMVFLGYGMLGALVCATVSYLFKVTGATALLPLRWGDKPVSNAPTINNLLFGAGLPEIVLASGLVGLWLWTVLWNLRTPPEAQAQGVRGVLPNLLGYGLVLGMAMTFIAMPIGAYGFSLRTMHEVPWAARPFFGLISAPLLSISAFFTIVPLVLLVLGLLLGAFTALAVAFTWPHFPEEPVLR